MAEREEKPTQALDPRTITGPNWPVVLATLEQIGSRYPYAMRVGIAALLKDVAVRMTAPDASAELVAEAQTLLDALRHMPWETR